MKYNVTYSCGHTGTVELFGKASDREAKIKWYETKAICPDCYKAAKLAEEKEIESSHDLPELTGSEKQVSWAQSIRAKKMDDFDKMISDFDKRVEIGATTDEQKANAAATRERTIKTIAAISAQTDAKYWIDNRDKYVGRMVSEF